MARFLRECACGVIACAILASVTGCNRSGSQSPELVIRVANTGVVDFDDVPALVAHDALRAAGYRIEVDSYRFSSLAVEAVARGHADIGIGASSSFLTAMARGAAIGLISEHVGNPHRLVAQRGLSCDGLSDGTAAVQAPGSATSVLSKTWLAASCPTASPRWLFIQQSENRMAALLSGQVDAAVLKAADLPELEILAPGRFEILADFAQEWPALVIVGVFVNREWADTHRSELHAYLDARRQAASELRSEAAIAAAATAAFGPSTAWLPAARRYIDAHAWWPDEEAFAQRVSATLSFLEDHDDLPPLGLESVVYPPEIARGR